MIALTDRVKELNIKLYQPSHDADYALALWWEALTVDGIDNLLAKNAHSLSGFLHMFRPPNSLFYTASDNAIQSAFWAEPVNTSPHTVFFSSWVTPELRGTRTAIEISSTVYELIFAMGKKVIIGITKQPKLLKLHRNIGYDIIGSIPYLFDESSAWMMYLTKDAFEAGELYSTAQKIKESDALQRTANVH